MRLLVRYGVASPVKTTRKVTWTCQREFNQRMYGMLWWYKGGIGWLDVECFRVSHLHMWFVDFMVSFLFVLFLSNHLGANINLWNFDVVVVVSHAVETIKLIEKKGRKRFFIKKKFVCQTWRTSVTKCGPHRDSVEVRCYDILYRMRDGDMYGWDQIPSHL